MTVYVVSILQSHSSSNIGGISTPLTNGVSMAAVTGGCVSVSTNGRPGSKSRGSVEDRGRGGHSQEGGELEVWMDEFYIVGEYIKRLVGS